MNKKIAWFVLALAVVVLAVFYYLHLNSQTVQIPSTTINQSTTTSLGVKSSSTEAESALSPLAIPFQIQDRQTDLSVGAFNISPNIQGNVLSLYKLSPTVSSSVNEYNPNPAGYLEYHWQDLKIVNGYRNSVISTSKQTINLALFNINFLTSVWMFAFQNNHYFLISGSDCGTQACHAEYYMYLLDGENNLTPIVGQKIKNSNFFWTVQSQGFGGYSSGNPEGVVAVQNKLYFVFLNQAGASTLIFGQDGAFDKTVNTAGVGEYGSGKIDLDKIVSSWNLQ